MKRVFESRLCLNNKTTAVIDQTLRNCCWLYNYLLEQFRERDKNKQKQPTWIEQQNLLPMIKERHPFLKEVQSNVLQDVAKRVHKTWQNYTELKRLDPKKKHPNFKPIHRYHSFIYNRPISDNGCGYKVDNSPLTKKTELRKLKLTLGSQNNHRVYLETKICLSRNIERTVKTLTIKRKNGKYYALFSCDNIKTKPLPKTNKNVGIDVNLNKQSYITLSNGVKYKHPQHYKKNEKKIIVVQKELSSKIKGSQNWKDAKLQLAKKWEKMVNQSKHETYRIVNDLVKNYDGIAIEKLQIQNMMKNKSLSKSIQQARWGILFKIIADKTSIVGRQLVRVNPRNTSQRCSNCNELATKKLTLKDRQYNCQHCYYSEDRDINSAKNILNLGFDRNLSFKKKKYDKIF